MRFLFILLISVAFLIIGTAESRGQSEASSLLDQEVATRLSEHYIRVARFASMTEPITTDAINAAMALIRQAVTLTPDDESVWRLLIEIASMAEQPETVSEGIQGLLRLTPDETTSQLARLRDVINQLQTASERVAVYEQLLGEEYGNSLDSRVASQLAYDAAMLQRQLGDVNQFARWLAVSVALDPSNPNSMTLAAGFFGDETVDAYQRTELLASAVIANLLDISTQITLAEFLMSYGDYKDARAMYEVILDDDAGDVNKISDGLLADIILSQWADGDPIAGLDALLSRQIVVDQEFRENLKRQQPRMSPLELARIHAPLIPKLAAMRAVLYSEQEDKVQAAISLEAAVETLKLLSQIYTNQGGDALLVAGESLIQSAWLTLWLDGDVETAKAIIQNSEELVVIDPLEKQRLDGWISLREGEYELALSLLAPLSDDPAAELGIAVANQKLGNLNKAASRYLNIARMYGGTMIGVWAHKRLSEIVNQEFEVREEVKDLKKLMKGVLQTVYSFTKDPRPPFSLRIQPTKSVFSAYEPIILDIKITNNTVVPLGINRSGPIHPLLFIEAILDVPGTKINTMPAILIPIDRQLNIPSRGSISFQTDLRHHWVAGVLNEFPTKGATIHLRSIANFSARQSVISQQGKIVYERGRFGVRDDSEFFRVDGCRLSDVWLAKAIEQAGDVKTMDDLASFVLLSYVVQEGMIVNVIDPLIPPVDETELTVVGPDGRLELQNEGITTILSSFPGLGTLEQAWVLAMMSSDPSIEAVRNMSRDWDDLNVQLAWLCRFATPLVPDEALDDSIVLLSLESENEQVKAVAKWIYFWINKIVDARTKKLLGPEGR